MLFLTAQTFLKNTQNIIKYIILTEIEKSSDKYNTYEKLFYFLIPAKKNVVLLFN